jgi:hypothetical protein
MRKISPAVACRTGKKIEWDPVMVPAKDCPEAASYIHGQHRKGGMRA